MKWLAGIEEHNTRKYTNKPQPTLYKPLANQPLSHVLWLPTVDGWWLVTVDWWLVDVSSAIFPVDSTWATVCPLPTADRPRLYLHWSSSKPPRGLVFRNIQGKWPSLVCACRAPSPPLPTRNGCTLGALPGSVSRFVDSLR